MAKNKKIFAIPPARDRPAAGPPRGSVSTHSLPRAGGRAPPLALTSPSCWPLAGGRELHADGSSWRPFARAIFCFLHARGPFGRAAAGGRPSCCRAYWVIWVTLPAMTQTTQSTRRENRQRERAAPGFLAASRQLWRRSSARPIRSFRSLGHRVSIAAD